MAGSNVFGARLRCLDIIGAQSRYLDGLAERSFSSENISAHLKGELGTGLGLSLKERSGC
jgi:hypothetical protein